MPKNYFLISCEYQTATKDIHAVCEVADGDHIIRSSTYDQTTYIVLTSVFTDWRHVLISVSQTKLLNIASLRSITALARSNLGK